MIGISIAAKREWKAVLDKFQINLDSCTEYPFGEYFTVEINTENVLLEFNVYEVCKCFELAYFIKKHNQLPDDFHFKSNAKSGISVILRKNLSKTLSENDMEEYNVTIHDVRAAIKFIANNAEDDVYKEALKINLRYTDKYYREVRSFVINKLLGEQKFVTTIGNREVLNKIIEDYYLIKDERNNTNHARPAKGQSTADMIEGLLKDALDRLRYA